MLEEEALGNPFEIWDGHWHLRIMIDTCNNCSATSMFKIFVGHVGLDKTSLEASLEKQTLTSKGLEGKKF